MDNKTDIEFKVGDQAYTKPGFSNFIGEEYKTERFLKIILYKH